MSKKNIWLIIAGSLIVLGMFISIPSALLGGARSVYITSDGIKAADEMEDNVMSQDLGTIKSIDISVLSANVELIQSNKNYIEYNIKNSEQIADCIVTDGVFTFKTKNNSIINLFSINTKPSYIKLYYDKSAAFDDVFAKSASGSVNIDGISAKTLDAQSTSGSRWLSNVNADSLTIGGLSGSAHLDNITAKKIDISNVSGSIHGNDITCEEIIAKSTSGSIHGNDIKCEEIITKNTSGSTEINQLNSSAANVRGGSGSIKLSGELKGKTVVSSVSGSIKINVAGDKSDYGYKLSSVSGSCKIDDEKFSGSINMEKENVIEAKNTSGSIKINFE